MKYFLQLMCALPWWCVKDFQSIDSLMHFGAEIALRKVRFALFAAGLSCEE